MCTWARCADIRAGRSWRHLQGGVRPSLHPRNGVPMPASCTCAIPRWMVVVALGLATACGDAPVPNGEPVVAVRDSTERPLVDDATTGATVSARPRLSQPALPAPRRPASIDVEPLWTVGGPDEPGRLIQPVHLRASRLGVLVSELDGAHIRVLDSRTGAQIGAIGRYGLGPGEFGRVPLLLGTYDRPLAFEGPSGRISVLGEQDDPITSRVAAGHSWTSACQVDASSVLLTYVGWDDDGYFVSTLGAGAALSDSFSHPIASLREVVPVARQAPVYQADDSTCVILPTYAGEFATYRRGRIQFGRGIEPSGIPRVAAEGQGVGASRRVAAGVRATNRSATSWRGRLLILYAGDANLRRRLVDICDERLRYESRLLLPFVAQFISVSGDTLFALGERNDEPILGAFLLGTP